MNESNILTVYISGPNATGQQLVARPCNLRGFWVVPNASSDVNLRFYNVTAAADVAAANLLLGIDVDTNLASSGYDLPGNGIRFDTAIWIRGAATTIQSITAFYQ